MAGASAIGGEPVPYGMQAQDALRSAKFVDTRIARLYYVRCATGVGSMSRFRGSHCAVILRHSDIVRRSDSLRKILTLKFPGG